MNGYNPSLLDKLLGTPTMARGKGASPRMSVEQIKDSVARDIELLLNTHASFDPDQMDGLPHASRSLLTLGLPDISTMSLASDKDRQRLTNAIRRTLADHDRRLTQVEVRVRENTAVGSGVGFSIKARLLLDLNAEPVTFDAVMQPGSNRYAVSKSDGRQAAAP